MAHPDAARIALGKLHPHQPWRVAIAHPQRRANRHCSL
jgi:hypothetical protein